MENLQLDDQEQVIGHSAMFQVKSMPMGMIDFLSICSPSKIIEMHFSDFRIRSGLDALCNWLIILSDRQ